MRLYFSARDNWAFEKQSPYKEGYQPLCQAAKSNKALIHLPQADG
jgi:hypothetical protein